MKDNNAQSQATDYTPEELKQFDRLTNQMSSPHQLERISGRLAIRIFVDTHGKAKCDRMWEAIQAKESQRDKP